MKATFQSNRNDAVTLIDIEFKSEAEMEIIAYMKKEFGYEEIAADHDFHITLGIYGSTIKEMKEDYRRAKLATR